MSTGFNYEENTTYKVRIVEQIITVAKSGNFQVAFQFQPFAKFDKTTKEWYQANGPRRTVFLPLTAGSIGWVADALRVIGFDGTDPAQLDPQHENYISLVGKEADAYFKYDTYNGKRNEKWNFSRGGGNIQGVEPGQLSMLKGKFSGAFNRQGHLKPPTKPSDLHKDNQPNKPEEKKGGIPF